MIYLLAGIDGDGAIALFCICFVTFIGYLIYLGWKKDDKERSEKSSFEMPNLSKCQTSANVKPLQMPNLSKLQASQKCPTSPNVDSCGVMWYVGQFDVAFW